MILKNLCVRVNYVFHFLILNPSIIQKNLYNIIFYVLRGKTFLFIIMKLILYLSLSLKP